jgi:5-(carboxyamino)imidazole ribonucleotide synthase
MILEAFVDFVKEVSVIVARDVKGNKSLFPVVENKHANHILKETTYPANVDTSTETKAAEAASKIADAFGFVGVLCVEMFVSKDGGILVNELGIFNDKF